MVERSSALIDTVVENRGKIAEMGMKVLEKVQEDDTGKKMLGKGLEYMKKIKEEGGIEGALKKGQAIMADEKQRDEMIEKVKTAVLDFLLKVGLRGGVERSTSRRSKCPCCRGSTARPSTRSAESTSPGSG